jgi:hypothetical protein
MAFSQTSLATLNAQLASRLGDSTRVYYSESELDAYLHEALRLHGAASLAFRERVNFSTIANQPFYDLPTLVSTQLGYSVTDRDIIKRIQWHLCEPSTGDSWTGTDQFSLPQIVEALYRRLNIFLVETNLVITETLTSSPISTERYSFPEEVLDIRRLAIKDVDGKIRVLRESDERQLKGYASNDLSQPGVPRYFSRIPSPRVSISLTPPPNDNFKLHSLTTNAHPALDPENTSTIIQLHDDVTPSLIYGTLADLLGTDGQAYDPLRAEYCEVRWREWITLGQLLPCIIGAQIDGKAASVDSLYDLDASNPRWQSTSNVGQPKRSIYSAGHNLVALEPIPDDGGDAGSYAITLDIITKAPVTESNVQITRDQEEAILRYAQHVAEFKKGADRIKATQGHYSTLIELAAQENERLMQRAGDFTALR